MCRGKRCERKGGVCLRKKDAPDNAELVVGRRLCKGRCGCYKIPETTTPEMTSKILINFKNRIRPKLVNAKDEFKTSTG